MVTTASLAETMEIKIMLFVSNQKWLCFCQRSYTWVTRNLYNKSAYICIDEMTYDITCLEPLQTWTEPAGTICTQLNGRKHDILYFLEKRGVSKRSVSFPSMWNFVYETGMRPIPL